MATWDKLDTPPDGCRNKPMVNEMSVGHQIVAFSQNKENGVQEFGNSREKVPPEDVGKLKRSVLIKYM
jgi:hypothetical protein